MSLRKTYTTQNLFDSPPTLPPSPTLALLHLRPTYPPIFIISCPILPLTLMLFL